MGEAVGRAGKMNGMLGAVVVGDFVVVFLNDLKRACAVLRWALKVGGVYGAVSTGDVATGALVGTVV